MIGQPTGVRIWLAAGVTDLRKGFDGLSALVQTALDLNPYLCDGLQYVAADGKRVAKRLIAWTPCLPSAMHKNYRFSSRLITASLGRYRGTVPWLRIPAMSRPRRIISTSAAA